MHCVGLKKKNNFKLQWCTYFCVILWWKDGRNFIMYSFLEEIANNPENSSPEDKGTMEVCKISKHSIIYSKKYSK